MKAVTKSKQTKARKIWIPILVILLAAGAGFGYYYWRQQQTAVQAAAATNTTAKTAQVRKGSLTISTSGSGVLVASQTGNLGFATSGTVASVDVQVGDLVKQGQTLAQLEDLTGLQDKVNTAQQDLITAQQALDTLKQNAAANLANAQIKLAAAKKAVVDAQAGVVQKNWTRCDQTTLDAYYYNYTHAKAVLDGLGDGGGSSDYYLKIILPQKNIVAKALATYNACAGYTDYEVSESQATLSLTQAELAQAQTTLDTLTKNNGLDPLELSAAENKVASAKLALATAQANLTGATLTAPFAGTVLTVAGQAGDTAGTGTFITIADLAHPQVEFSIDETDMDKVAVGEKAKVTFDAVPDQTFTGTVLRINPALETSGGYQVVKGLIQLELSAENAKARLLKGMNGTVDLVEASAENILLVPAAAVHDLGGGTYSVFVVGTDGKTRMKVVEVGLQDAASVEIKSGLSAGDVVTTGTVQTQ